MPARGGALCALLLLLGCTPAAEESSTRQPFGASVSPKWVVDGLPSKTCPGGTHTECHPASPVLADLDGDGVQDIVVATRAGVVLAYRSTPSGGQLLWQRDLAADFGMAPGTQEIHSSPAVADVDRDGLPEVIVGTGTTVPGICTQGGVIVLEHDGARKTGWPFLTHDGAVPPAGCRDSVESTPAVADLDGDGDLEIVAGSFDKRIYALHHDGTLVQGFPPDSHHALRFPTWPNLRGSLGDTIWSSAALADITGDGRPEIFIGTDEGNYDPTLGGDAGGWTCPYALPPGWAPGYCGGSLYGLRGDGSELPGFPRYVLEIVQSVPAIDDVDSDGVPEIFVGTGTFYANNSPDHPTSGYRLFGFRADGSALAGWQGGKSTGGSMPASPAIGDIADDSAPEIVVLGMDGKLYAWHHDGSGVAGFPMTPRTQIGTTTAFNVPKAVLLVDYDADGKMEILFNQSWTVTVVDGDGTQLSTMSSADNKPLYLAQGTLANNPAVGDVDGDGQLELVVNNSRLLVWDLPAGAASARWPMFKQNAARTSSPNRPRLVVHPADIVVLHRVGDGAAAETNLTLESSLPAGPAVSWSASAPHTRVSVTPAQGTLQGSSATLAVRMDISGLSKGTYNLGQVELAAEVDGKPLPGTPVSVPVKLILANAVYHSFLPFVGTP